MAELSKIAEPENLNQPDKIAIHNLKDAFTLAQVDNLVAEVDS